MNESASMMDGLVMRCGSDYTRQVLGIISMQAKSVEMHFFPRSTFRN